MRAREIGLRLFTATAAATCAFTVAWIAWGLATPGDYFANGSPFAMPTLALAIVLGLVAGFLLAARYRIAVALALLLCLGFWFVAPSDWWVTPPPRAAL
jgi:hypothetical protein